MAPSKPNSIPAAVAPDRTPAQTAAMEYIANPVTVAGMAPNMRDDIAVRDAVRKALAETEAMVGDLLASQTAEGFSLAEIYQLFVLEVPLMVGIRVDNGRVRTSYDARVVDRQA